MGPCSLSAGWEAVLLVSWSVCPLAWKLPEEGSEALSYDLMSVSKAHRARLVWLSG